MLPAPLSTSTVNKLKNGSSPLNVPLENSGPIKEPLSEVWGSCRGIYGSVEFSKVPDVYGSLQMFPFHSTLTSVVVVVVVVPPV